MSRTIISKEQFLWPQKTVGEFYAGDTVPGDTVSKLSFDGKLYSTEFFGTLQSTYVEVGDSEGLFA